MVTSALSPTFTRYRSRSLARDRGVTMTSQRRWDDVVGSGGDSDVRARVAASHLRVSSVGLALLPHGVAQRRGPGECGDVGGEQRRRRVGGRGGLREFARSRVAGHAHDSGRRGRSAGAHSHVPRGLGQGNLTLHDINTFTNVCVRCAVRKPVQLTRRYNSSVRYFSKVRGDQNGQSLDDSNLFKWSQNNKPS